MTYVVGESSVNLILPIRIMEDDNITPVEGLTYATTGFSIDYKLPSDATWTNLVLVSGTNGTWSDKGFSEDPDADGWYQLGFPNNILLLGYPIQIRIKTAGNNYRYGFINPVSGSGSSGKSITFAFNIPGAEVTLTTSTTLYIKELQVQATFTANTNIEAIPLVVIFEKSDKTDAFIVADTDLTKNENVVTFTLPAGFTDDTDTFQWAVRHATTKRLYGQGSVTITYAPHEDA